MDELDPYGSVELPALANMLRYAADQLSKAPDAYLHEVDEDIREAALTLIPAAEHVQERREEDSGHHIDPGTRFVPPPPRPAPRYTSFRGETA